MKTQKEAVEELSLLLMYLTRFQDNNEFCRYMELAWKGYDFGALNQLEEQELIIQPRKSKYAYLTEKGKDYARELLRQYQLPDQEIYERFEFREIRPDEAEQAAEIERICFPPNEGITTINSDLANDLGNLVSRTVSMVEKYFAGQLPVHRAAEPIDEELMSLVRGLPEAYAAQMEAFAFQNALGEIFRVVSRANKYIDETTPWILAKDEGKKSRLAAVMYNLLEAIRVCAILLAPFMPDSSEKMLDQIGAEAAERTWESAQKPCALRDNVAVKKGETLFPRIDMAKELAELAARQEAAAEPPAPKAEPVAPPITVEDFFKVDLRVCRVTRCEAVPKAKKLLRLELDDGMGGRQIVSSIHPWYEPEDLVGRNIIVIVNLKPAKFCGVESNGMLLAGDDASGSCKVVFADQLPAGTKIG